jgi:hypothetical protein
VDSQASKLIAVSGVLGLFILGAYIALETRFFASQEIFYASKPDTPVLQIASVASGMNVVALPAPKRDDTGVRGAKQGPEKLQKILPARIVQMEEPKTILAPFIISSGTQPASSLALSKAGGVPFTNFTLTAGDEDVKVRSLSVRSAGAGDTAVFDSISLNSEDGTDISDAHFDATRSATFRDEFTIPAKTSKSFTIVGNMIDDVSPYDGEAPQLAVVSLEASAPLSGALPITGSPQTINSTLIIGGATAEIGEFDPGADGTHYIDDKGIRFAGIRITANSEEDLTLSSITWRQNGTASPSDIANVTTVSSSTSYPAEATGREFTSTFSPALLIPKGTSIELYVKGDLLETGAQRTVKMDIDSSDDVSLTGNTYGYGVGIAADGNTATSGDSVFITSDGTPAGDEGTPFYSAPVITIQGGSVVNIQNAN